MPETEKEKVFTTTESGVVTYQETGEATVPAPKPRPSDYKDILEKFEYTAIQDNLDNESETPAPTFDQMVSYCFAKGYSKELQRPAKIEGQRGKASEPRSLTRAIIFYEESKNSQESRAAVISAAVNTPDRVALENIAALEKAAQNPKATDLQRKMAEAQAKLGKVTTKEELETVLAEIAALSALMIG